MHDIEQAIRERAYHLWIESGKQEGLADQHWLTAQRSILSAALGASDVAEAPPTPKKARSRQKKRVA